MQESSIKKSLVEPSAADLLAAMETTKDLSVQQCRHRSCSLRIIAKALGKPPELLPARWTALRQPVSRLHHVQMGMTAKTLANHKANVRAALRWFAKEKGIPSCGAPLSPVWANLGIIDYRTRAELSSPMRFWSAQGVAPQAVDESALDSYMVYRGTTTALETNAAARRRVARAWNRCVGVVPGWPSQKLIEPPVACTLAGPAWDEFPANLRRDIENYLAGLKEIRRTPGGKRIRPCKPSTIKVRRAKLVAFVRKAVRIGIPLDSLSSFRELLDPNLVERVFDAYWKDKGEHPSIYLIELPSLLLGIARERRCLDHAAIATLDDMRAALEEHRPEGLTEKNPVPYCA
jgi:hypothetical protein